MNGKYLLITLVISLLLTVSLYNIDGLCPLCREGVSTFSQRKIKYLNEYTRLKLLYESLSNLYNRLLENGFNPPVKVGYELDTLSILLRGVYIKINNSRFGDLDRLLYLSEELVESINKSLDAYTMNILPNRWLADYYSSEYLLILDKVNIILEILPYTFLDKEYKEYFIGLKEDLKRLLNGLYSFSVAEHESKLSSYRVDVDRMWLLLGLDKVFNGVDGLDWEDIYYKRVNVLNLLRVAGEIVYESGDFSLKRRYREYLSRVISLLGSGDEALFITGDYYAAGYVYSLVDGYLRYFIDNREIIFGNRTLYRIYIDSTQPIIYINDPLSNHTSTILILDRILLYRDINGNLMVDPDEVIGELHICNALWKVEKQGSGTRYFFSNYLINISVAIGGELNYWDGNPLFGFEEYLLAPEYIKFIQINYSLATFLSGGVESAPVFRVLSGEPFISLRWDYFMSVDSLNLDLTPNNPLISIYFGLYGGGFSRNLIYLYKESCCPKEYEVILYPISKGGSSRYLLWIRSGVYVSWWDHFINFFTGYNLLVLLLLLFAVATVLAYLVRNAYLIDVT